MLNLDESDEQQKNEFEDSGADATDSELAGIRFIIYLKFLLHFYI